jgi:hypothetical protein
MTEIVPPEAPGMAEIDVDVELPFHPEGNDQVYDVAPVTAAILYVWDAPWHTVELPEIIPGCPGSAVTVTLMVLAVPEPQELFAITEIVPPVAPGAAKIDVVVELPLHPEGNDHVYEVAPDTADIL